MRRLPTTVALTAIMLIAGVATAQADIRVQQLRSFEAVEGSAVNAGRIVAFDDVGNCAASAYQVNVAWGDGTTSAGNITFDQPRPSIPGAPDAGQARCEYQAVGSHEYRSAGTFAPSATVCRAAECVVSGVGAASIREADVRGEARPLSTAAGLTFVGQVAEFNDGNRLATASDYGAVIDWGDGSTSGGTIAGTDGRFVVSGTHVYAAAGQYLLRVTLLQGGAARVIADAATVTVGAGAGPAPVTAQSVTLARPTLRMRTSTVRRAALARGLPIRITAPSSIRSLRMNLVRITGTRVRSLGAVTVRLRRGRVVDGVRTANLRVRLPRALRNRVRSGSYALRFRVGDSGLISAQFRVR
jgi:hypothetical protein